MNLTTTTAQNTVGDGTDTITGIENLTGSAFNDTLTGDGLDNILTGGAGNDALAGGAGNDTYLLGLADGTDTITEGGGTDTITIQSNGAALSSLDFTDSSTSSGTGNLVINFNGQQATVTKPFLGSNNMVETLTFSGGATYAGFDLGSGAYTLSIDDSWYRGPRQRE